MLWLGSNTYMISENCETLIDVTGKLVGFTCFKSNGETCLLTIYDTPDAWVICAWDGELKYNYEQLKKCLGKEISGENFYSYAARGILKTVSYSDVKQGVEDSVKPEKMEWYDDSQ